MFIFSVYNGIRRKVVQVNLLSQSSGIIELHEQFSDDGVQVNECLAEFGKFHHGLMSEKVLPANYHMGVFDSLVGLHSVCSCPMSGLRGFLIWYEYLGTN